MQLVLGQQRHAVLELGRQHLQREAGACLFLGGDVVQRLLERQAVVTVGAVVEQLADDLGHAVLAWRLLDLGHLTHLAEHADGAAHMLGLHDQPQPVGQHDGLGWRPEIGHVQLGSASTAQSGRLTGLPGGPPKDSAPPKPRPATGLPDSCGVRIAVTACSGSSSSRASGSPRPRSPPGRRARYRPATGRSGRPARATSFRPAR